MPRFGLISIFKSKLMAKQKLANSIYHTVITPHNLSLSTHFYRDGIGLSVLDSVNETGNFKYLYGADVSTVQEVFLGDSTVGDSNGVLDLVYFPGIKKGPPSPAHPVTGYFLIAFFVDINSTLARLSSFGLGGVPKVTTTNNITFGEVWDPDGLRVLLLERD